MAGVSVHTNNDFGYTNNTAIDGMNFQFRFLFLYRRL